MLKNLVGITNRSARFRTVITLIQNGKVTQFEGIVNGKIIDELKGTQGFGYDPIFIPEGYDRTFAEMDLIEKGVMSHRGRAFQQLVAFLT